MGWNEAAAWPQLLASISHLAAGPAACQSAPRIPCPAQPHCPPGALAPECPGSWAVGQVSQMGAWLSPDGLTLTPARKGGGGSSALL